MLKGRLGLDGARVPHGDRHGCMWLQRGELYVESGTLRFRTAGGADLERGDYSIAFQTITNLMLGPGSTVSHDAMRLMARHGTGLVITGEDGVRLYASMPFGSDDSALARRQATAWADKDARLHIARRMYAWRLGELLPSADVAVLRGIEGARVKAMYRTLAQQHGVEWHRRDFDRLNPELTNDVNTAINHAAAALRAAAMIAVSATSTLPQLGFVHEDSGNSFCLDIADLFREEVALPAAFRAVRGHQRNPNISLERLARRQMGTALRTHGVVPAMIDRIKQLFQG